MTAPDRGRTGWEIEHDIDPPDWAGKYDEPAPSPPEPDPPEPYVPRIDDDSPHAGGIHRPPYRRDPR